MNHCDATRLEWWIDSRQPTRYSCGSLSQRCWENWELGGRTGTEHVHLYSMRRRPDGVAKASLRAGWSVSGAIGGELCVSNVPLNVLFARGAEILSAGQPFFAALTAHDRSCSRLITALLRETHTTGYLLCPVHLGGRF